MGRRKVAGDDKVAVGYIRVSTSEQELGPVAQEKAIQKWCRKGKVHLAAVERDEGLSGGLEFEKRPGLVQAIALVEEHRAGLLVVHKRDRLARDREIAGQLGLLLRSKGAKVQATDGPSGSGPYDRAMEGIQDIFAELERSLIQARTKAALQVKKDRGERVGSIPYGFSLGEGGLLIPNPIEKEAVDLVRELREKGLSLREIARELTDQGHEPRGSVWHAQTIANMLE